MSLRQTVLLVALLNLAYFGVEFAVAIAIGSVSLFADSVDFLEDASINHPDRGRARLERAEPRAARHGPRGCHPRAGGGDAVDGLAEILAPVPPQPVPLTLTGAGAFLVNFACAFLLGRFRHHSGSLTRAAFLSARNDVLANVAIVAAGLADGRHPVGLAGPDRRTWNCGS